MKKQLEISEYFAATIFANDNCKNQYDTFVD